MHNLLTSSALARYSFIRLRQNYPLQLAGATFRVAIAVRVLQVQPQSALSRASWQIACS